MRFSDVFPDTGSETTRERPPACLEEVGEVLDGNSFSALNDPHILAIEDYVDTHGYELESADPNQPPVQLNICLVGDCGRVCLSRLHASEPEMDDGVVVEDGPGDLLWRTSVEWIAVGGGDCVEGRGA